MTNSSNKVIVLIAIAIAGMFFLSSLSTSMAQSSKKGNDKQTSEAALNEGLDEIKKSISELAKKVYSGGLFSPKDNNKLIDVKVKLNDLWSKNPTNKELAKPFYDTALIFKEREMFDDAKEFLKIVIESFPPGEETEEGTPGIDYSAKAQIMLKKIEKDHPSN